MKKSINVCLGCCLLLLVLLMSACSNSPATTDNVQAKSPTTGTTPTTKAVTPIPTPTPTPKQLLEKSSQAMNDLTGVHFTLDAKRQDITPAAANPSGDILQALLPLPGREAYNSWKQGEGDESGANTSQIHLQEQQKPPTFDAHSGSIFTMDQRIQGDNVYLLGDPIANQKWYVISKKILDEQTNTQVFAVSAIAQIRSLIDLAQQKSTLNDKGLETINGITLRHIQATFSEENRTDLRAIDVENYNSFLSSLHTENTQGSSDFWIDANTGYVYRAISDIDYKIMDDRYAPSTIQQTLTFNCSRFNQSVSITIPQNPISTNDINQIYDPRG
ncbi:hypothetical protein [Dictyobacter kobayashii]|uniref:Lipoprotein n=1 Tax=Dictyobacter kobayashii TaxID=2014872 RepID=A0A402AUE1_9CHLR|nr:hypothetical protein [Dictyobacter kobayashii]GCE22669.1 hypothetical protein KDK_64690 [Dictyobacter kobayashii]